MAHQVQLTARARLELDNQLGWLRKFSPVAAQDWYDAIVLAMQNLTDRPDRYPEAPEAAEVNRDIRELTFGKKRGTYRLLFEIEGDLVRVVHVLRANREQLRPDDI